MPIRHTPIDADAVTRALERSGLASLERASIREIKKLIDTVEAATGERFIRMEMGIPRLPPNPIAVEAQIEALKRGVAAVYPDIQGIPPVKREIARFVKNFHNHCTF